VLEHGMSSTSNRTDDVTLVVHCTLTVGARVDLEVCQASPVGCT
jgi:hypothetical protein